MDSTKVGKKLNWKNYLAYGAGDLYGGGSFFLVTTFSMYYLINIIGLHPFLAGLIPAIGKVWDAVSDPLMGYIADKTPDNKFGKRRVWFLISIVPIAVSFALIWFPAQFQTQMAIFWFYTIAYIFFFTVTTFSYVPYSALVPEMTKVTKERNYLVFSRIMFSFIATLLAGLVAKPVIDLFGDKNGYYVMGIIFGLLFAIPWITLYFGTWELPQEVRQMEGNFIKNFFSLFKNRSCRIHILMYVASFGTLDIFMSWIMFYLVDYLDMEKYFVVAQGAILITMLLMLPIYLKIATKRGHAASYKLGLSIFAVGMLLMAFQTPKLHPVFLIANVIILGSGIAAGSLIPHQLMAFVVDTDKLMSGQDRAGTYSAAMTLSRKLFLGFVIMTGLGFLLTFIGYKNPVPSVLTKNQFEEAINLAMEKNAIDTKETLDSYYQEFEDGNMHLMYFENLNPEQLVKDAIKSEKKKNLNLKIDKIDPTVVNQDVFENVVLKSFDRSNHKDIHKYNYLTAIYKIDDFGMYHLQKDFQIEGEVKRADIYGLKVMLDDIGYKYAGIGTVIKPIQKQKTLIQLRVLFIILPLIMTLSGIIGAMFFKINPNNHKIILAELERLEKGGKKEDVSPETKKVVEKLIGIKYEKIWTDFKS